MGVAAIFGIFAGMYYWFPKMFGRLMHEGWGKVHFWFTLVGVYSIFMPMHLQPLHVFISIAAFITVTAQVIFFCNFFWSLKKGKPAGPNPWESTSLEWSTPSPPPFDNFGPVEPVVHHGPYEYSVPKL